MSRFEIFTGPPGRSVLIGLVDAGGSREAIETLDRHRRSPGATEGQSTGPACVEWAHPDLRRVGGSTAQMWRAVPVPGSRPANVTGLES